MGPWNPGEPHTLGPLLSKDSPGGGWGPGLVLRPQPRCTPTCAASRFQAKHTVGVFRGGGRLTPGKALGPPPCVLRRMPDGRGWPIGQEPVSFRSRFTCVSWRPFLRVIPDFPSQVVAHLFSSHAPQAAPQRLGKSSSVSRLYKAHTVAAKFQQSLLDLVEKMERSRGGVVGGRWAGPHRHLPSQKPHAALPLWLCPGVTPCSCAA